MNATAHLQMTGFIMVLLVLSNIVVPIRYGWREEMSRLSLLNRQIFQVHAIFICLVLALLSALLLTSADALLEPTPLARAMLIGLVIFWGLRLFMQFFYYSPRIWRGKRLETVMHVVFSLIWIYFVAVFGTTLWRNMTG